MINRVLIRLKVLQIMYSVYKGVMVSSEKKSESNTPQISDATKMLLFSLDKTYDLYFYLLYLVVGITRLAKIGSSREKSDRGLVRLSSNRFAAQLENNKTMRAYMDSHDMGDLKPAIKELYASLLNSQEYSDYVVSAEDDYVTDKNFWKTMFRTVISDNETLGRELEDVSIFWNDDAEVVVSFVIKTIKQFDENNGEEQELLPMYKDIEDRQFACDLLKYALQSESEYRELISRHCSNWDNERIAFMDIIIMQVALAEITHFPSIPVSVSINEYLEIAKAYSTEKSATFINGVLDSIVGALREENKLIKVARFTKNYNN